MDDNAKKNSPVDADAPVGQQPDEDIPEIDAGLLEPADEEASGQDPLALLREDFGAAGGAGDEPSLIDDEPALIDDGPEPLDILDADSSPGGHLLEPAPGLQPTVDEGLDDANAPVLDAAPSPVIDEAPPVYAEEPAAEAEVMPEIEVELEEMGPVEADDSSGAVDESSVPYADGLALDDIDVQLEDSGPFPADQGPTLLAAPEEWAADSRPAGHASEGAPELEPDPDGGEQPELTFRRTSVKGVEMESLDSLRGAYESTVAAGAQSVGSSAEPEEEASEKPKEEPEAEADADEDSLDSLIKNQCGDVTLGTAWTVEELKSFPDFVLDMGEEKHLFTSKGVRKLDSYLEYSGFLHIIADFPESAGAGVLEVSAKPKFAAVMLRKRLEEQGELTNESDLWVYSKEKVSADRCKVFYQILPRMRLQALHSAGAEHSGGYLLYDTMGFLASLAARMSHKSAAAVVMPASQALLTVAAKDGRIFSARRYPIVDDSASSLTDGVYTVLRDLDTLQQLMGAKIKALNWLGVMDMCPEWEPPETEPPVNILPVAPLQDQQGSIWHSSLPGAVDALQPAMSLGPKQERYLRPMEKMEPWLWGALLLMLLGLGYYAVDLTTQKLDVEGEILSLQRQTQRVRTRLPESEAYNVPGEKLDPALHMAEAMSKVAFSPSLAQVWNRAAYRKPRAMRVDSLSIQYQAEGVEVSLSGEVELALSEVQRVFHEYVAELRSDGFVVKSHSIDLDIDANSYRLTLQLPRWES